MAGRPPPLLQRPSRLQHILRRNRNPRHPDNEGNEAARPAGIQHHLARVQQILGRNPNARLEDEFHRVARRTAELDRRLARAQQALRRRRDPRPQDEGIREVERPSGIQHHLARVQQILGRNRNPRQENGDIEVVDRAAQLDRRLARVQEMLRRTRESRNQAAANRFTTRFLDPHRHLTSVQLRRRNRITQSENVDVGVAVDERPPDIQDPVARVQQIVRRNRHPREPGDASNGDADRHSGVQRRLDRLRPRLGQRLLRNHRDPEAPRRGVSHFPSLILARMQMRLRRNHPRNQQNEDDLAARRSALERRLGRLQQMLRRHRNPPRQGVARVTGEGSVTTPHRRRARILQPVRRRLSPQRQHDMDLDGLLAQYRRSGAAQLTMRRLRELRRGHHRDIMGDRASVRQQLARIQEAFSDRYDEHNQEVSGDAIADRASRLNRRIARLHNALRRSDDQRSQEVSGSVDVDRDLQSNQGLMRFREILRGEHDQQSASALHQHRDLGLSDNQQNQEMFENVIVDRASVVNRARLQYALRHSFDLQNPEPFELEMVDRPTEEDIASMQASIRRLIDQQSQEVYENEMVDRASVEDIDSLQDALRCSVDQHNQEAYENEMEDRASEEDLANLQEELRRSVHEQNQKAFENEMVNRASQEDIDSLQGALMPSVGHQNHEAFDNEVMDKASVEHSLQVTLRCLVPEQNQNAFENEMVDRASVEDIDSPKDGLTHEADQRSQEASGSAMGDIASGSHQGITRSQEASSFTDDQQNQEASEDEVVDGASVIDITSLQEALRHSADQQNSELLVNEVDESASALDQRLSRLHDTIRDIEVPPRVQVEDIASGEGVSGLGLRSPRHPRGAVASGSRQLQPSRLQLRLMRARHSQRQDADAAVAGNEARGAGDAAPGRPRRIAQSQRTRDRVRLRHAVQRRAGTQPRARLSEPRAPRALGDADVIHDAPGLERQLADINSALHRGGRGGARDPRQLQAVRLAMADGAAALQRSFALMQLQLRRAPPPSGFEELGRGLVESAALMQGRMAELQVMLRQQRRRRDSSAPMPGEHRPRQPRQPRARRHRTPAQLHAGAGDLGVASPSAARDRQVTRMQESVMRALAPGGGGGAGAGSGAGAGAEGLRLLARVQLALRQAHNLQPGPEQNAS